MANNQNDNLMTFGEHLEVFRRMLFRRECKLNCVKLQ